MILMKKALFLADEQNKQISQNRTYLFHNICRIKMDLSAFP